MSQEQRIERIKKLLTQGRSRVDIAEICGMSVGNLNNFMGKHKLYRKDFNSEPIAFFWKPDTLKQLEVMLLDKANTVDHICQHFKIQKGQLWNAVKRYKLKKANRCDWRKKPETVFKPKPKPAPVIAYALPPPKPLSRPQISFEGCTTIVGRLPRVADKPERPVYCCAPVQPGRVFCGDCFSKLYPEAAVLLRNRHA